VPPINAKSTLNQEKWKKTTGTHIAYIACYYYVMQINANSMLHQKIEKINKFTCIHRLGYYYFPCHTDK
jgi:hypothetical protein